MKNSIQLLIILLFFYSTGCEKEETDTLNVSKDSIEIPADGGSATFTIETSAGEWEIDNPATDWIHIPITTGNNKEALISLSVETRTLLPRIDTLTITAGNARPAYIVISQESSEYLYNLTTNRTYTDFNFTSGSVAMKIVSDAPNWTLSCDSDWVALSKYTGGEGTFEITISVSSNSESTERSATIYLTGEGAPSYEIPVTQKGSYPSYNTNPLEPDMTGMTSTALEIASKMKVGWNLGNTLEALGGETAWGNPQVTETLIQLVKANGFNAIRIPCSWNQYVENITTAKIKTSWLERVKQVVSYCVNNDMYVILNIHWDQGWLENNVTSGAQFGVNAKQKAFWEQIATYLRDFDEHLLFAGANEPNVENSAQMNVLLSYHQTFIDAVRSTGGKNSYRVLVVQGPSTDIEKTDNLMNTMPKDNVPGRLMAEIHYYTPYQFCLMTEDASWGKMFYYWGNGYHSTTDTERNANWGEEAILDDLMESMNSKFVTHGIPVILGEFAVIRRSSITGENLNLHLASRAYFLKYLTHQAITNGIIPFYWDAGNMGQNASALFNRQNNTIYDQQALDAIIDGANQ